MSHVGQMKGEIEMAKTEKFKTLEEFREHERQRAKAYYQEHAEELRAKRRARYYKQKLSKQQLEELKNK